MDAGQVVTIARQTIWVIVKTSYCYYDCAYDYGKLAA